MDNYRRVTSDQLRELLRRGESLVVLDVREPQIYEAEHIEGSVNIPLEILVPDRFLSDHPNKTVVLVCTSGKRAYQAADMFSQTGNSNVIVMAGGLLAWKVLGFPMIGTKHKKSI